MDVGDAPGSSRTTLSRRATGAMGLTCQIDLNATLILQAKLQGEQQLEERRLRRERTASRYSAVPAYHPRNEYEFSLHQDRQATIARWLAGSYKSTGRSCDVSHHLQLVQSRPTLWKTRAGAQMQVAPMPSPPDMTGKT